MLKNKRLMIGLIVIAVIISIASVSSVILDEDVEVTPNTDLTYYLDVKYDGVDVRGIQSSDHVRANINSGTIYVEDKIPEGLTFKNFVDTEDGSIGAVSRDDANTPCLGQVVGGVKGLNYDPLTRTVSFTVKNLQAGCKLTVGIVTTTPETVDDTSTVEIEKRRDFYNTATATEGTFTIPSNTVHVFMGSEDEKMYKVIYQYEGVVPPNAPSLPPTNQYAADLTIGVAKDPILMGYIFSGWSTEDADILDDKFTMPSHDVTLKGSFTEMVKHNVSYEIEGPQPDSYVLPKTKSYYENQNVTVDILKKGDIIDGYRFLGWETTDVSVTDGEFTMPGSNVVFKGRFEEITYTVSYQFQGENIPPNASELLPPSQVYHPGDTVKRADEPSASGYRFLGWYKEEEFIMPEHDVVIYGEWAIQTGTFEPTITKTIVNDKTYYHEGDVVNYEIKVTNTASYPIKSISVRENKIGATFMPGAGYEVLTSNLARITSLDANASITLKAQYVVQKSDVGKIINEVEIISALADNNYNLNTEKEYKDTASFKVLSKVRLCKNVEDESDDKVFQFHITGSSFDSWLTLNKNSCTNIFLPEGNYQFEELPSDDYTLEEVTGDINKNKGTIQVVTGSDYEITFKNKYKKQSYFHTFGRLVNLLKGVA